MTLEDLKSNLKKVEEKHIGRVVCLDKLKTFIQQAEQHEQSELFVSYQFDPEVINKRITNQIEVFNRNLEEERVFRLSTPAKVTEIDSDYDFGLQILSTDGTENVIYRVFKHEAESLKQEYIEKVAQIVPLYNHIQKDSIELFTQNSSNVFQSQDENGRMSNPETKSGKSHVYKHKLEEENHYKEGLDILKTQKPEAFEEIPGSYVDSYPNSEGAIKGESKVIRQSPAGVKEGIQGSYIDRPHTCDRATKKGSNIKRTSPEAFEEITRSYVDRNQPYDVATIEMPRIMRKSPDGIDAEIQRSYIDRHQTSDRETKGMSRDMRKNPDGLEEEIKGSYIDRHKSSCEPNRVKPSLSSDSSAGIENEIHGSYIDRHKSSYESLSGMPRIMSKSPEALNTHIHFSRSKDDSNPGSKETGLAEIGTSIVNTHHIDDLPHSQDYLEPSKLSPVFKQDGLIGHLGKPSTDERASSHSENYNVRIRADKEKLESMNQDMLRKVRGSPTLEVEAPDLKALKISQHSQEIGLTKTGYQLPDSTKSSKSVRVSDRKETLKGSAYLKPKASMLKPKPEKPKKVVLVYPNLPITTQKDLTSAYGTPINFKPKSQASSRNALTSVPSSRSELNSKSNSRSNINRPNQ